MSATTISSVGISIKWTSQQLDKAIDFIDILLI